MSVRPGKGGQTFITASLKKIKKISTNHPNAAISIDGGVDATSIAQLALIGTNEAICGTSVFKGNPVKNVEKLMKTNSKRQIV